VTRQGVVLTDLQSLLNVNNLLSLSLSFSLPPSLPPSLPLARSITLSGFQAWLHLGEAARRDLRA
jgi:hypothetical protein